MVITQHMDRIDVAKESVDPITKNLIIGFGPISFKKIADSETQ
jgi:hypothetical protein